MLCFQKLPVSIFVSDVYWFCVRILSFPVLSFFTTKQSETCPVKNYMVSIKLDSQNLKIVENIQDAAMNAEEL